MESEPSFEDLIADNWPAFREWKPAADEWLREAARATPTSFHRTLREALLEAVLEQAVGEQSRALKLNLVLDSGVIITDAFGVGRGYQSSTPHLLESPFVSVFAPADAWEEVPRKIREKKPPDVNLDQALQHGDLLLSKVTRIDRASPGSVRRATELIGKHSPEDVNFLAVAFDIDADAIVSFDKRAYDNLGEVERWSMKDGSEVILRYESGTLSLGIASATTNLAIAAAEVILGALGRVIREVLAILSSVIEWFATRSSDAFEQIPTWAWAIIIGVGIGLVAAYAFVEEFRSWVNQGLGKAAALVSTIAERVLRGLRHVLGALKELFVWLWQNVVRPLAKVTLFAAGVILSHIDALIRECEADARATASRLA